MLDMAANLRLAYLLLLGYPSEESASIDQGLADPIFEVPAERQMVRGKDLREQDCNQLLFRIHEEVGIEDPAPGESPNRLLAFAGLRYHTKTVPEAVAVPIYRQFQVA